MMMRRFPLSFFLFGVVLLATGPVAMQAQVVPSALRNSISLTVGGTASLFDPDYLTDNLGGLGAYVDLTLFHGIGVEAEGRWQRLHEYQGISQDNYLIGPRVQLMHFWRARPYVKALGGFTNMNFEEGIGTGRFTTLAFGGGIDIHVKRRWTVRAVDAEYQYWPTFLNGSLSPYGVSAGVSYRIF
jgi:outer membrane protein with beta-barrel domain